MRKFKIITGIVISLALSQFLGYVFFVNDTPVFDPNYQVKISNLLTFFRPSQPVGDFYSPSGSLLAANPHSGSAEEVPSSTPLSDKYLIEAEQADAKADTPLNQSKADENRGRSADLLGNTNDAMNFYNEALSADPQNVSARTSKAELLAESGSYSQAAGELENGLAVVPEDVSLLVKLSDVYMYGTNNPEKAVEPLLKAVQISPSDGYLRVLLADAYIANRQYDQATATIQSITDQNLAAIINEKNVKIEMLKNPR